MVTVVDLACSGAMLISTLFGEAGSYTIASCNQAGSPFSSREIKFSWWGKTFISKYCSEKSLKFISNFSADFLPDRTSSLEIRASSKSSRNFLSVLVQYLTVSALTPATFDASATVIPEPKALRKSSLCWALKALVW